MNKILAGIYIFQISFSVVFGDNSNDESSVCQAQDPARDVAFVRIGRYRKESYPSRHNSIKISYFPQVDSLTKAQNIRKHIYYPNT